MNKNRILGLIGIARRANKIAFGTESVTDNILKNKAKLIIITEDAAERTKKNFNILCDKENVDIRIFGTIDEISKSIGQNNKAVICIKDENFSKEIIKIIDGGDIIG